MSLLTDIGNSLITGLTGTSPSDLQTQLTAAETQLQIAASTMLALEAIIAVELFLLVVMSFKERH